MRYPVIVESKSENEFVAEPIGKPELRAVAKSEAEALAKVENALEQWLRSAKLVQLEVAVGGIGNPWTDSFRRSADDPDFEEFLEEIGRSRS